MKGKRNRENTGSTIAPPRTKTQQHRTAARTPTTTPATAAKGCPTGSSAVNPFGFTSAEQIHLPYNRPAAPTFHVKSRTGNSAGEEPQVILHPDMPTDFEELQTSWIQLKEERDTFEAHCRDSERKVLELTKQLNEEQQINTFLGAKRKRPWET